MVDDLGQDPVADVRRWMRAAHPPAPWGQRLDRAYTYGFVVVLGGILFYGTAKSALGGVISPGRITSWGPAFGLLGLLGLARWGAYQGPVVFSPADVFHLLGAPLRRRGLALARLARALVYVGLAGGVFGGLALVGLAGAHEPLPTARAIGLVAGFLLLGVLGTAAAHAVVVSRRWDRWSRRLIVPIVVSAVAPVVAGPGSVADGFCWSGPWGWASLSATHSDAWPIGLAALALVALLAAAAALRAAGGGSTERHMGRAEARAGSVAALTAFDARSARRSMRNVADRPARSPSRLRAPSNPRFVIVWRGGVALTSAPLRMLGGLLICAGGGALATQTKDDRLAAIAFAILVYIGGAMLLEALREEVDNPHRTRILLRQRYGVILREHALLPSLLVTVATLLGVIPVLATDGGSVAAGVIAVLASPVALYCAALSARRGGRLPMSVLSTAVGFDPSGSGGGVGLITAWLLLWPGLALLLAGGPVAIASHGSVTIGLTTLAVSGFVLREVLTASTP